MCPNHPSLAAGYRVDVGAAAVIVYGNDKFLGTISTLLSCVTVDTGVALNYGTVVW